MRFLARKPKPATDEGFSRAPELLTPVVIAYRRRLDHFGPSPRGVFWRSRESAERRFQVLVRVFDDGDRGGGIAINDLGCGYGAFFEFIRDHPAMRGSRYVGYDICPEMVAEARARIRDPRATFVRHLKATETADYSFVSGTFNLKLEAEEAAWNAYVKASLELLWQKTRKGLAFNMLDPRDKEEGDGLYYADPLEFLEFVRARLSADARLIEDYGVPDWTILLRRRSRR
jgi:SAM-dependent methyltransferase